LSTGDKQAARLEEIRESLWTAAVGRTDYEGGGEKYQAAVLEQYKVYVEMADRISARRGQANTFFLTLNTALVTAATAVVKEGVEVPRGASQLAVAVVVAQCMAWWWLVRSYRLLNSAKYEVIGMMEERLPASPYWRAEWKSLGEGKDWRRYLPLTHLEQWAPVAFAAAYLWGFYLAYSPH
jgi:hypothetical protein